jgi:hypothetical protein
MNASVHSAEGRPPSPRSNVGARRVGDQGAKVCKGDDARRALAPLDDLAMSGVLLWLVGYLGHAADADMSLPAGKVLALVVERCAEVRR